MTDITKKLRASLRCDAINGDSFERSVCGRQMREAADEIDRLRAEVSDLRNEVAQLCGYDNAKEMDAHRAADANRHLLTEGK